MTSSSKLVLGLFFSSSYQPQSNLMLSILCLIFFSRWKSVNGTVFSCISSLDCYWLWWVMKITSISIRPRFELLVSGSDNMVLHSTGTPMRMKRIPRKQAGSTFMGMSSDFPLIPSEMEFHVILFIMCSCSFISNHSSVCITALWACKD